MTIQSYELSFPCLLYQIKVQFQIYVFEFQTSNLNFKFENVSTVHVEIKQCRVLFHIKMLHLINNTGHAMLSVVMN